jgi:hypothetical protein
VAKRSDSKTTRAFSNLHGTLVAEVYWTIYSSIYGNCRGDFAEILKKKILLRKIHRKQIK